MGRPNTRVTFTRELHRQIAKAAKEEQRTMAEWIRLACKFTLARRADVLDALKSQEPQP